MRKPSQIELRKAQAELIVQKHFGKNYDELLKINSSAQLSNRIKALVTNSCKDAGINISTDDLALFIKDLMNKAESHATKAREDYIFILSRRSKLAKYGATAFNAWKLEQLRKLEQEEPSDES